MAMLRPPHPGEVIRHEVLEPLGATVSSAAKALGVTRAALSNMLNARAALSPEMALRIEKAFGPRMEHLMRIQLAYDIAQTRARAAGIRVRKYARTS